MWGKPAFAAVRICSRVTGFTLPQAMNRDGTSFGKAGASPSSFRMVASAAAKPAQPAEKRRPSVPSWRPMRIRSSSLSAS